MNHLGAQYRGPSQQNQSLEITLRYEPDNKIFNIEIEQSMQVQELIQEVRRQLNIPERKLIILKQGSNQLEENRLFSSYGFPKQVMIDIITQDPNQTAQRQQAEKPSQLQNQSVQQQDRQQSDISTSQYSEIEDKEIMLVILVPQKQKVLNVQMPESTTISQLIDQLKQLSLLSLEQQDQLQVIHRGQTLPKQSRLRDHGIQKGTELTVMIPPHGG